MSQPFLCRMESGSVLMPASLSCMSESVARMSSVRNAVTASESAVKSSAMSESSSRARALLASESLLWRSESGLTNMPPRTMVRAPRWSCASAGSHNMSAASIGSRCLNRILPILFNASRKPFDELFDILVVAEPDDDASAAVLRAFDADVLREELFELLHQPRIAPRPPHSVPLRPVVR